MDVLRHVILVVHLIGFAMTLGALLEAAYRKRFEFNVPMNIGLAVSLVTGVILSAPFGDFEPNYPKIVTKVVLLVVLGAILGMGMAKQRKSGEPVGPPMFWAAVLVSVAATSVAVLW
ncbi:Fe-S protein [Gordonia alkaliphila]|uniref:Fe-S protein n=1 Tax=Gordonia alkaliphila TaxID=1053547 RepID=UPI001FF66871|nr:Fe-S protein [Gordonia alkaliphila]MCK0438565.1 Fe-S protein [Gordonia alkaliphila]